MILGLYLFCAMPVHIVGYCHETYGNMGDTTTPHESGMKRPAENVRHCQQSARERNLLQSNWCGSASVTYTYIYSTSLRCIWPFSHRSAFSLLSILAQHLMAPSSTTLDTKRAVCRVEPTTTKRYQERCHSLFVYRIELLHQTTPSRT